MRSQCAQIDISVASCLQRTEVRGSEPDGMSRNMTAGLHDDAPLCVHQGRGLWEKVCGGHLAKVL